MKKLLILMMVLAMVASLCVVSAFADGATLTVGSATVDGDGVATVPVTFTGNPGVYNITLTVTVGEGLKLTSIAVGDGFNDPANIAFTSSGAMVMLDGNGTADFTNVGELLKISVEQDGVSQTAKDIEVSVAYTEGDISNYDEEDVNPTVVAGKVSVPGCGHHSGWETVSEEGCDKTVKCKACGYEKEITSHTFDTVSFAWTDDCTSCVATYKCSVCEKTVDAECVIGEPVVKEATCTEKGSKTYTATAINLVGTDDKYTATPTSDTKTVEIKALGHKIEKVDAVAATHVTAGNTEYFKCSRCGALFADAEGATPTTLEAVSVAALGHDATLTHHEAVAATTSATGTKEYWECSCGTKFSDEQGTKVVTDEDLVIAKEKDTSSDTSKDTSEDNGKKKSPQTGDKSNIVLWTLVLTVSVVSVGAVLNLTKKSEI